MKIDMKKSTVFCPMICVVCVVCFLLFTTSCGSGGSGGEEDLNTNQNEYTDDGEADNASDDGNENDIDNDEQNTTEDNQDSGIKVFGTYTGTSSLSIYYSGTSFNEQQNRTYSKSVSININEPLDNGDYQESNPFHLNLSATPLSRGGGSLLSAGEYCGTSSITNEVVCVIFDYWKFAYNNGIYMGTLDPETENYSFNAVFPEDLYTGYQNICSSTIIPDATIEIEFGDDSVTIFVEGEVDHDLLCNSNVDYFEWAIEAELDD